MIIAGISAINRKEALSIWHVGGGARWSIVVTFLATLVLSIPLAVMIGVLVSIVFYVATSASDFVVRAVIPQEDGSLFETQPPKQLPSNAVTLLDVYGNLFFGGARTLEELLPSPAGATRPVVVLRLRGRTKVGATLVEVLDDYADELAEVGGRLYLSGLDQALSVQLRRSGKLDLESTVHLFPAGEILGASTREALAAAGVWLGSSHNPARTQRTHVSST